MTDDKIALRTLLEKSSDASMLREMIGFATERLMALETEMPCGAAPGERSADRINQRNGYRDRDWHTRAGTVELVDPLSNRIQIRPRELHRSLARELGPLGITVNAVAPGFIATGMTTDLTESDRREIARRSALGQRLRRKGLGLEFRCGK